MDSRPIPGEGHPDGPDDVEARWAEIIADLGSLTEPGDLDDPDGPDALPDGLSGTGRARPADTVDDDIILPPRRRRADDQRSDASRGGRVIRPAAPEPGDEQGTGPSGPRAWAPDPEVEEAENHFVPPDPGPVLGGSPLLTLAWVAVAFMPVLAIVAALFWREIPVVVLQVAGLAFLGGIGVLLWRMPHRRDPDDDDPGAVV